MEQENQPILRCEGLTKRYGPIEALSNLNLAISPGQVVGLLGPNGSGKTTLIKLICGLIQPTSGTVTIGGKLPGRRSAGLISYLPERTALPERMTVENAIDYYSDFYSDFNEDRCFSLLADLDIDPSLKVKTLSKGNREKVQLILVMSRDAELYLLDEPIGGVDPAARDYILRTIIGCYRPESTILFSTHMIADVEPILDRVIFLRHGILELNDRADTLRAQHQKSIDQLFREVYRC